MRVWKLRTSRSCVSPPTPRAWSRKTASSLKAEPFEQRQRAGLIGGHAGDDFGRALVQNHLERQLQQEPADANSAGRFATATRSSATWRVQLRFPGSNVA